MNETSDKVQKHVDSLYEEAGHWHVNTGGETIHAKRMPGRYRTIKWLTMSVWLIFFLGPYLRWSGRQAILLDIPGRKFHIFDITILAQDVWMLSLVLLFFAILLAVVTSIAGRIFCGYFCFQTVWTDIFTFIEDKLEGNPAQRRKLDQAPLSFTKLRIKASKHALWLLIAMLTGISFAAWFTDAYQLWHDFFTLQAAPAAWAVLGLFTAGTYVLAGYLREQVCFWLCPYARIQGVMYDKETILPYYDFKRGEPRGKLKKGEEAGALGDCIDCNQCVAVCPTGIDIREGQQEGCITCGLCLDACDLVMKKIDKPKGLIRYASYDEIQGLPTIPFYKRPRVLVYMTILSLALIGILWGITHLGSLELKVLHERSPLFVRQSDGSIMNRYELKILNKVDHDVRLTVRATGIDAMTVKGNEAAIVAAPGRVKSHTIDITVPADKIPGERSTITFTIVDNDAPEVSATYNSMFIAPAR
ncbi:MAG TPA: cytochrome c oxidase accessory protein CcoG [Gammaproteobacteria bacterium]